MLTVLDGHYEPIVFFHSEAFVCGPEWSERSRVLTQDRLCEEFPYAQGKLLDAISQVPGMGFITGLRISGSGGIRTGRIISLGSMDGEG